MVKSALVGKAFSFHASLENWAEGMDYCAVPVPAEITKALGTKGPVLVEARVNRCAPFQVSLFPVGGGQHYIRIKASIRKLTATKVGDNVDLRFVVLDPEDIEIPEDLNDALNGECVLDAFMSLPPGKRNFIIRRINEAVKSETRAKRVSEGLAAALDKQLKQ